MDLTVDVPAPGVRIAQPRHGFRYGSEAMWLAAIGRELGARTVLDLGTGSGVVAALLAAQGMEATGVDVRPEWAEAWSITLATAPPNLRLVRADVRDVNGCYDLVVSNPPFFPAGSGPVVADPFHRAARTEDAARLGDFVAAALRCIGPRGAFAFVLPREREDEVRGEVVWRIGARRSVVVGPDLGGRVALSGPDASAAADAWRAALARGRAGV